MEVLFPRTLNELLVLRVSRPEGKIMAGGTDLLVQLRRTGLTPPVLFCLDQLPELGRVEYSSEEIRFGAAVTLQKILENPAVKQELPTLYQAASAMASPPVRHAATLGGNICTASPAGDTLPPLYVLDAQVELRKTDSIRRLPLAEFITGPGQTVMLPEEILTAICIPRRQSGNLSAYYKVGRRQALAIAVVSLAVQGEVVTNGTVRRIRLAWGSVGPTVVRLPGVENFLADKPLTGEILTQAATMAANGVSPINDIRASAAYRRRLAGNLLMRLALRHDGKDGS